MLRWIFCCVGVLLFSSCAGSRQTAENPELQPWVGIWQGMAIPESRHDQPRQWQLTLSLKKGRLQGLMSDDLGEMRREKLQDLKILDGELHFRLSYETARGLHRICSHRVTLQDENTLLSLFGGSEGGRELSGKWEAKRMILVPKTKPQNPE
ncbi:MAG: hypothetical protein ALAOOOJD_00006 [bacterium]|nr:hypothetical protein [bacterium]